MPINSRDCRSTSTKAEQPKEKLERIEHARHSSPTPRRRFGPAAIVLITRWNRTTCRCPLLRTFRDAESHAAYIANWLTVLKDDERAAFTAASLTPVRRLIYLHILQPQAIE